MFFFPFALAIRQIWKVKKLIKSLDNARGAGTSMISLILPPRVSCDSRLEKMVMRNLLFADQVHGIAQSQISQTTNMLTQEYGTASNIKSRVNRLSVLGAITSTQQRLKLYTKGEL